VKPELRNRIAFGAVLILIIAGTVAADVHYGVRWGILALGLAAAALGGREFARMARVNAARVRTAPMLIVSLALVAEAHLHAGGAIAGVCPGLAERLDRAPLVPLLLGAGLVWSTLSQMSRFGTERFFANIGGSLFGMVYLGVSLNLLERLALISDPASPARGLVLVGAFLAAVKCGDIAAYFGGRAFGRRKLCPTISPGKSWEGFLFSFLGSVAGTYGVAALAQAFGTHPFSGWWQPAVWGLVLGPLGAAGDLVESCMKRDAAMKDSGRGAPGFGGYLDLLDAVILAAPVAFLLAMIL
jgi:phosphatidate cytidylyltransferase